jgi:hypothetical protein
VLEPNLSPANAGCGRPRRRRRLPIGYLSVRDVAERSESARSTVYRHIELGRLPACTWRGITVISERAAEDFLAVKPLRRADADHAGQETVDD